MVRHYFVSEKSLPPVQEPSRPERGGDFGDVERLDCRFLMRHGFRLFPAILVMGDERFDVEFVFLAAKFRNLEGRRSACRPSATKRAPTSAASIPAFIPIAFAPEVERLGGLGMIKVGW